MDRTQFVKVYTDQVFDARWGQLSPAARCAWIECLCLSKLLGLAGKLPDARNTAWRLHWQDVTALRAALAELAAPDVGWMEADGDWYQIAGWEEWQSEPKTGAERQAEYVKRKRTVTQSDAQVTRSDAAVTASDTSDGSDATKTETETETETSKKAHNSAGVRACELSQVSSADSGIMHRDELWDAIITMFGEACPVIGQDAGVGEWGEDGESFRKFAEHYKRGDRFKTLQFWQDVMWHVANDAWFRTTQMTVTLPWIMTRLDRIIAGQYQDKQSVSRKMLAAAKQAEKAREEGW